MRHRKRHRWVAALVGALCGVFLLTLSSPSEARKPTEKERTGIIVSFAFGGAGLALGGVLAGLSAVFSADADDTGEELRAKGYRQPCAREPETCEDIDTTLRRRDGYADASLTSFAVGGSLVVIGVAAIIAIAAGKRKGRGDVMPRVVATRNGVALQVTW